MPETQRTPCPAAERDIRNILGPVDDEMVFVIRETGASREEVLQAFTWLNSDDDLEFTLKRPMSSRARAVYEILLEAQGGEPEGP